MATMLFKIWEDELYDDSFEQIIAEAIEEARTALTAT